MACRKMLAIPDSDVAGQVLHAVLVMTPHAADQATLIPCLCTPTSPPFHAPAPISSPPPLAAPQSGDEECLAAWGRICAASRKEFQAIYDRLGVTLTERGESFYNPMLKGEGRGAHAIHRALSIVLTEQAGTSEHMCTHCVACVSSNKAHAELGQCVLMY
jgi:hypothetical protein